MLELALERVQGSAVLVVVIARPAFGASFASHPVVTRLVLNGLARAAVQLIVDRISAGRQLPEAVLDEIAVRSGDVPLFVEEMTKAVLESGALLETADAYHLGGPLSGLEIPASLHDSLMARLDRLHPAREVAQAAAVIGRSFDHATIAALTKLPEPALGDAMLRLVEAELVFRRGTPPEATYRSSMPWYATPPTKACSRPSMSPCTPAWLMSWRGPSTPPRRSRRNMPRPEA